MTTAPVNYKKKYQRYKRKYRKYKKAATVSRAVKAYVKKTIHKNIENKEIIGYGSNVSLPTWDVSNNGFSINLVPTPVQGSADSQRTGNEIKIVKGVIKGQVNLRPYDASTNPNNLPCWVKIYILRDLTSNAQYGNIIGGAANMFRGNSSALGFQGNCLDLDLPINQDYWRLLASKTFKIGQSQPHAGFTPNTGFNDNSPFCKKFYFDYTKYIKKTVKFNDGTVQPNNCNLYIAWQVVPADGSSGGGKVSAEVHYVNMTKFEDA